MTWRDYERAGVPMLPVVKGESATPRAIVRYTLVLVAATLLPFAVGTLGLLYLGAAVALGAVFATLSLGLARRVTPSRAGRLFRYSLAYLALLFAAMSLDPVLLA